MIYEDDLEEVAPLWRRVGAPVAGLAGAGLLAWLAISQLQHSSPAPRPHQEPPHIVNIKLPPPPPPPKQPQKPEPVKQMPSPVKASVPKPTPRAPSPPAALTTSIKGAGNSGLGYGANGGGGDCLGSGCGNGDGGGDQSAYFANLIKTQIETALARDDKLRFAHYRVTVALRMDLSGRAVRATIRDFSGEADLQPEIDRVLLTVATNEKLPPDIASQPVLLRINAHGRG